MEAKIAVTSALLTGTPGVRHGFFTRQGGVSGGIYESLNCGLGSKDSDEDARENRRRAMAVLGSVPDLLVAPYQVHSPDVLTVRAGWSAGDWSGGRPKADAVVTDAPGLVAGIVTADCGPVLLADTEAGVVGAAHAGWRGALAGVIENTVEAMEELGAEPARIVAAVGPCIAQPSYEVGREFYAAFIDADADCDRFFIPGAGEKLQFDLKAFCAGRLRAAGVQQIDVLPHDTCADEALFFSNRRAVHRGEGDYGRLLSAIVFQE